MLAMDVVDTIRHRELLVARELSQGERDDALRARLREIYRGQGIEVTDAVIDQGILALRESRFAYTPPAPGLGRSLALLWIRRGVIGRWVGGILIMVAAFWGFEHYGVELPRQQAQQQEQLDLSERLPKELAQAAGAARVETRLPAALAQIDALERDGQAALGRGDASGARTAIAGLTAIRDQLVQTYTINVISRPGEASGVWRVPNDNPSARNYYLIVEAIGADGRPVSLPIKSEETGETRVVSTWGVRVPESFFDTIKNDKLDNGIIERNPVGQKVRGELEPRYVFPKEGGAITSWDE
jgi:hypothetical protein